MPAQHDCLESGEAKAAVRRCRRHVNGEASFPASARYCTLVILFHQRARRRGAMINAEVQQLGCERWGGAGSHALAAVLFRTHGMGIVRGVVWLTTEG